MIIKQSQPLISATTLASPAGYTGLYRFHKYWGKKPHEPIAYLIQQLTRPGDVVFDPFVGCGTSARETVQRSRRFIGFDINPVAVELSRLLIRPPDRALLQQAAQDIDKNARTKIQDSYLLEDGATIASHYLWNLERLQQVWLAGKGRRRQEFLPAAHDLALSRSFANYRSQHIRPPRFFSNSRINASPALGLNDLLTGRAQRNIDLLLEAIDRCPADVIPALKLCLTAASGQMTRMVFAVTGRGKTSGRPATGIEVGSWVIGYWRPALHFEVNVWNCFQGRLSALLKALPENDPPPSVGLGNSPADVIHHRAQAFLGCGDSSALCGNIPDGSVDLIITDPPHGDRIPYLELSEFWNSILGQAADFAKEMVISNARERGKTAQAYQNSLSAFLLQLPRLLAPAGCLVLLFNARLPEHWQVVQGLAAGGKGAPLCYFGHFPCVYSAHSVVQDNRAGSLKCDYALVFGRAAGCPKTFLQFPGWSSELPHHLKGKPARGTENSKKTIALIHNPVIK